MLDTSTSLSLLTLMEIVGPIVLAERSFSEFFSTESGLAACPSVQKRRHASCTGTPPRKNGRKKRGFRALRPEMGTAVRDTEDRFLKACSRLWPAHARLRTAATCTGKQQRPQRYID